jgi:translation initiation factor 2 subunit 2
MSEEEYNKLLEKALLQLPPKTEKRERFELPSPSSSISGNRTILHNFAEICNRVNRDKTHFLKFLAGELATSGSIEGAQAIFQGNFEYRIFRKLFDRYIQEYVFCPICHQPDTNIVKKGRFYHLVCEACGASSSLRNI